MAWAEAPFTARGRAVRLHVGAVDQDLGGRPTSRRQGLEHLAPYAFGAPTDMTIVEGLGRAVALGRILPAAARLQHVHDPADHPSIIDPRHASRLVGQPRLQPRPLLIAQPELAHDSPSP